MNAIDSITLIEGYDAMRIFLEMALRRLGTADEEIALIVAGLKWADGAPIDPTMPKRICHQLDEGIEPRVKAPADLLMNTEDATASIGRGRRSA